MSESQLRRELKRKRPFCTAQQEVVLSLLRTSDQLENQLARFFRKHELTLSQFTLLRVLQMEVRPMTCGEIGERMIQMASAVTRLVGRLEKQGLVARQRCADDRRVVHVSITEKGSATVDAAYAALLVLEKKLLRLLNDDELNHFIGLMDKTRRSLSQAETSSHGKMQGGIRQEVSACRSTAVEQQRRAPPEFDPATILVTASPAVGNEAACGASSQIRRHSAGDGTGSLDRDAGAELDVSVLAVPSPGHSTVNEGNKRIFPE